MLEIISPITGERLQLALNDFEEKLNWFQAKAACNDLGNGWRLPTKSEIEIIYKELYSKGLGSFLAHETIAYWSSTEYSGDNAWYFSFWSGKSFNGNFAGFNYSKDEAYFNVRAVKSI